MGEQDKINLANIFKYAIIHFSGDSAEVERICKFKNRLIDLVDKCIFQEKEIDAIKEEVYVLKISLEKEQLEREAEKQSQRVPKENTDHIELL